MQIFKESKTIWTAEDGQDIYYIPYNSWQLIFTLTENTSSVLVQVYTNYTRLIHTDMCGEGAGDGIWADILLLLLLLLTGQSGHEAGRTLKMAASLHMATHWNTSHTLYWHTRRLMRLILNNLPAGLFSCIVKFHRSISITRGPRGPWVAHLRKRSKVTVEPIIENPRGIIWTTLVEDL